jgi:nucleoside 2-deoxyribosyltransferase
MKTCYIATRFSNKEIVQIAADLLLSVGIQAIQTWQNEKPDHLCDRMNNARRDIAELERADMLIVLTKNCELVPGGMHFETGFAYARAKRIVVIGPPTNIFHFLPEIERYDHITHFMETQVEKEVRRG